MKSLITCIGCKQDKPKSEFYLSSLLKHDFRCKECIYAKTQKYRGKHSDKWKAYQKKYKSKRKIQTLNMTQAEIQEFLSFGTTYINGHGYEILCYKGCEEFLHRVLYCASYRISLKRIEGKVIHHKDEDKLYNTICNLRYMSKKAHDLYHNKRRWAK